MSITTAPVFKIKMLTLGYKRKDLQIKVVRNLLLFVLLFIIVNVKDEKRRKEKCFKQFFIYHSFLLFYL